MSDLVVIGFDDEHKAFELRAALAKLQKGFKGKVLKTSLTKDKEEELREFLDQA